MPKLRTKAQNSKMFGLAAKCGLTHDDLRDWAADVSNGRTEKTSKLYIKEADAIINHLDALVNPKKEWSPRTIRYHRQKSGIKKIVSQKQTKYIDDLRRGRGISDDGLKSLCKKILNGNDHPRTSKEAGKIIEALKAMNARDENPNRRAA